MSVQGNITGQIVYTNICPVFIFPETISDTVDYWNDFIESGSSRV